MSVPELTLYIGRANYIKQPNIKRPDTGDYDDSLTLSMRLVEQNDAETALPNGTAAMAYIGSGLYAGTLSKNVDYSGADTGRAWLYIEEAADNLLRRIDAQAIYEGSDKPELTLYVGQPNYFTLSDVRLPDDSGYDNTLTLTLTLKTLAGVAVTGGSVSLPSISSTGDYAAFIPAAAAIEHDTRYNLWITDSGANRTWCFKSHSRYRGAS